MTDSQRVARASSAGQLEGLTCANRLLSEPRWRFGKTEDGGRHQLSLQNDVPLEHFARRLFAKRTRQTDIRRTLRPCQGSVESEAGRC